MDPMLSPEQRTPARRLAPFLVVCLAVGLAVGVLVVLAGRSTTGEQADEAAAVASAGSSGDAVDDDFSTPFDPVDAVPAPTATPVPTPPPRPDYTPPFPTPSIAPPGTPPPTPSFPLLPPPAPPSLGSLNQCPGYEITTPAMIVWGLGSDDPDGGLVARTNASLDAPIVRVFPVDALTQFITGGCRLGPNDTPWLEFGDANGSLAYASSRYLRPSRPVCLQGRVNGRRTPDSAPDTLFQGPITGHGYAESGPFAAFIPNDDIGVTDTYRLVPVGALTFDGGCRS